MTTAAFADSSALVKLYADEADAATVRRRELVVVSQLARVEVPAALWRKHRIGDISAGDASLLVAAFEADWFGTEDDLARFVVVRVTPALLDEAARLIGTHGLRAYDGVQLASARAAHDAADGDLAFVAFDRGLCTAAAREGLPLLAERG
ncbi:MAG TPA: type II toxin-antitoxin system VapC family toxin [Acidimicrobiales bacterium]|nr:type II toxin-antitoxin system VapC family toxin [Acidimicrobiales bacterium]